MYNHTTLTCKTFLVCKFWYTKPCLRTLIWLIRRLWDAFTVNIRTYTKLFWRTETCLCTTFDTWVRVCVSTSLQNCINCETWQRARFHKSDTYVHHFDLQGRACVSMFTQEGVFVSNLSPNFLCLISTTTFPHKCVVYETCSCACSHTTRRVSAHFLTYKNMFMRNI